MDDFSNPQPPQRPLTFHYDSYSSLERLGDPNPPEWVCALLDAMRSPSVDHLKLLLQNYTTGEHIYFSFRAMIQENRANAPQIFRVIVERLWHIRETGPIEWVTISHIRDILTPFMRQRSDRAELHLYWNALKLLGQVGVSVSVPVLLKDFEQLPLVDRRNRMNFLAGVECRPESTARLVALCEASPDPDAAAVLECVEAYADVCAKWPGTEEPIICRVLRECSLPCALACLQSFTLCLTLEHIRPLSQRHDLDEIRQLMRVIVANRMEYSFELNQFQEIFIADCWSYGVLSAVWPELKRRSSPPAVTVQTMQSSHRRIALRRQGWEYDWAEIRNAGDECFFDRASDGGSSLCKESPSTAALNRLTMARGIATIEGSVVERYVVENGANVSFLFYRRTILSRLVECGNIAAVAAAFRTPYPIDFTVQHPFDTSILHIVAGMENIDIGLAMLRLIVNRLCDHPAADRIDFSRTGWSNRNFLSLATQCGCLALFWKEVQCLPHFSAQHGRIPISVRVSLTNDFLQIPEEDRRDRFDFLDGVGCCPESTARLVALFAASPDPDAAAVLECVEAYADVCAKWPGTDEPIICRVLRECSVACALACLHSVTLSLKQEHILPLSRRHDMDEIRELMRVIATDRVECRCSLIYEQIDWQTFISECWRCGVLSAVWPELCRVPMMVLSFGKCGFPAASLQGLRGWSYDWQTLCGYDPQWKKVNEGEPVILWEHSYATGALFRLASCTHPPSEALVRRYVKGGANVNYADESGDAILHRFVRAGHVAAVKVMLEETADPIDFTLQGTGKNNVFHTLCEGNDDEVVQQILSMMVSRLQRNPTDRYDFKQRNGQMKNLLSWASLHHRLSMVFPAVRDFPFFADQLGKIKLQENVSEDDWRKMEEEDQKKFTGVRIV